MLLSMLDFPGFVLVSFLCLLHGLRDLSYSFCPPVRTPDELHHFALGPYVLDQFRGKLRSRGAITQDSNFLPLGLEAIVPCCAVEDLALERLRSFDAGGVWPVESTNCTDNDGSFPFEDFPGNSVLESAHP